MNILLIIAANSWDPLRKQDPFMPLSLPILASCAPEHHYTFVNMLTEEESVINIDGHYDVVGISFRVSATSKAFALAEQFRIRKVPVVLGGPQASCIPLEAKKHADAVVLGEAENTWSVLLQDITQKQLHDFYLASPRLRTAEMEGYTVYAADKLPDLSEVPHPLRKHFQGTYTFPLTYAARGCPIDCSFCCVSSLFGSCMRFRKMEDVAEEIDQFGTLFYLIDDTVLGRKDTYRYYKALYTRLAQLPKKRFWTGQANLNAAADAAGREVIQRAAQSGLTYIAVGMETFNPEDMQKNGVAPKMGIQGSEKPLEAISQNIAYIQSQGIALSGWFTIGLEHDSVALWKETLQYCIERHVFPVFSPIQALEGTRYYEDLKSEGKLTDAARHVTNVQHDTLKDRDFIDILEYTLEKAYSTRTLIRTSFFYFQKIKKLKPGFYALLYRMIFIIITQRRLKGVLKQEIKRFNLRLQDAI